MQNLDAAHRFTSPAPGEAVPAREVHRFVDVTEDLAVVVVFAPPEGSLARA